MFPIIILYLHSNNYLRDGDIVVVNVSGVKKGREVSRTTIRVLLFHFSFFFFFSIYIFFLRIFTISGRNICDSLYNDVRLLISLQYCIFDPVGRRSCNIFRVEAMFTGAISSSVYHSADGPHLLFDGNKKQTRARIYTLIKKCHRLIYIYIYI